MNIGSIIAITVAILMPIVFVIVITRNKEKDDV